MCGSILYPSIWQKSWKHKSIGGGNERKGEHYHNSLVEHQKPGRRLAKGGICFAQHYFKVRYNRITLHEILFIENQNFNIILKLFQILSAI